VEKKKATLAKKPPIFIGDIPMYQSVDEIDECNSTGET
jgi:hypothetical protein